MLSLVQDSGPASRRERDHTSTEHDPVYSEHRCSPITSLIRRDRQCKPLLFGAPDSGERVILLSPRGTDNQDRVKPGTKVF
ncbi:MAG: hypothetical protein BGN84_07450 [Afipia sp. 62-7]|nr:MAG: hypothetical protein BGN84_07450 [Afipia sp. 62-7]